jgi:nucleoside-diphosphate kinase
MSLEKKVLQRTLSIIKPDAIRKHIIGKIIERLETNGLQVVAAKMILITPKQAEQFYAIHKERPFFKDLVKFISSGPVIVQVLEGPNAIEQNRKIMGATNPIDALPGTIRKDFADSIDNNSVHGSDSLENAKIEIAFFFAEYEIFSEN